MLPVGKLLLTIGFNLGVIVGVTVAIGAWAPRWPVSWLAQDRGLLQLTRWETGARYRRFGVHRWARRLPEAGGLFGSSKRQLPGRSREVLAAYLIEVRRAEWVHWLSLVSLPPLATVNPWWLWWLFALVSVVINIPFLAILRYNRIRLLGLLPRLR